MIRLGTRRSALALAQATAVAEGLRRGGATVEIVPMGTEGDRLAEASLARVGGKGLFVREIEEALLAGRVDIAVHSLKDLPAETPAGLALAAFPAREDPRDVLVTRTGTPGLETLPAGSVVGTSSPRRRALVLAARPDLVVEALRGNVDTRLRKLAAGTCAAVILAAAGLRRLGVEPPHAVPLAPEEWIPAVGQGIVAVETRAGDAATRALLAALDHAATRVAALAERGFLGRLGASCNSPMAAHAVLEPRPAGGHDVVVRGLVASEDGRQVLRASARGAAADAEATGRWLAEAMLEQGAADIAPLEPARGAAARG